MSSQLRKISVTVFVGLIILAFALSGTQFGQGDGRSAGQVGPYKISLSEYERSRQFMLQQYQRLMGGKALTAQQMRQFRINETAWSQLVNRKYQVLLADRLGLTPAKKAVRQEIIKNFPGGGEDHFDFNRYQEILKLNGIPPQEYEESVTNQLKLQATLDAFDNVQVSDAYASLYQKVAGETYQANAIEFQKEQLRQFLPVKEQEVDTFLAEANNQGKLQTLFDSKKAKLAQPEQIKARHILLKADGEGGEKVAERIQKLAKTITPQNFATQANRLTEDPSGKGKGGDLGWFGRGKMVPEFEQIAFGLAPGSISDPVKTPFGYHLIYVEDKKEAREARLEDHQRDLAKELIRQASQESFEAFVGDLKTQWLEALKANQKKKLETIRNQYLITLALKVDLRPMEDRVGMIELDASQMAQVFERPEQRQFVFEKNNKVVLLSLIPGSEKKLELAKIKSDQSQFFGQYLQNELLEAVKADTEVQQNIRF